MEKEKFVNSMLFKHLILANDSKELTNMLDKNDKPLELFLNLLRDTYEIDEDFFALDKEITNKVLDVITHYRFDYKDREKYTNEMNDYIIKMNLKDSIKSDERIEIYKSYKKDQEHKRILKINSHYELLYLLRNDMIVYQTLLDGDFNHQTFYLFEESMLYFIQSCPKLYDDENFLNNTCRILVSQNNSTSKKSIIKKTLVKEMNKIQK